MENNNNNFMDKREPECLTPDRRGEQSDVEQDRKIRRYKLTKMESYNKFDIKGIIRLQYLEQKKRELMFSYNSTRLNRQSSSKSKSKTKRLDMIIPSFQAFNINATFLPGFNQFENDKSQIRPRTQSRSKRQELKRGKSMQDSVNLSQQDLQIQIKLPLPQTKSKIYWNRNTTEIKKQTYGLIHNKNQNSAERKFRSKNVQNILRRKASNFPEMIAEYCRRMKLEEKSRIFIFQSGDAWLKEILQQKGWVINPDVSSKIFHLKWTSKICNEKADENQLVNHFYESDSLTSKEGLAKMVKQSKYLSRTSPRSFDLGTELKQFVINFNQTQILCCLKKIVSQIQGNKLIPSQITRKDMLKKSFNRLRAQQDFEQRSALHNFILHVPYAVQLCAMCQNIRCELQQQARQPQNRIGQKTSKNLFNFSILNPPYVQYQTSSSSSQLSDSTPKIHFNSTDINLYSSVLSFSKPSAELIKLLYSYHTYFCENLHTYRAEGMNNIWIVKNRNSSKGMGITLSYNLHELVKKTENKLVQKYIEDCALYRSIDSHEGYKYDLRVWVLVTSFNPIICYFYEDFYCRLCSQPYSFNTLNSPESHLTNYTQNKESFENNQRSSIIPYPEFLKMAANKLGKPSAEAKRIINSRLQDLVFHTISAYKNTIRSYQECFQLYGFDIILSESLEMFLLEVNLSPACIERDEWLSQNVRKMGRGLMSIVMEHERVGEGWVPVLS